MKYGFIGLGSQGAPMARRMIEAGLDVVLWARNPSTLTDFRNSSASFASSVEELGAQVQHCGICVVDDEGVNEVCKALLPAMQPGSTIAIHSTVHPHLCQRLARVASLYELYLVDAPVSGGGGAANAGRLTVMVGGTEEAFIKMRAIFETFSGLLIHLGGVGTGQMAKLVNNSMMAANLAIAHESFMAAKALGVDLDEFTKLVRDSSGHSFAFDVRARMEQIGDFKHGATMLNKDLRLLGEALGDHPSFDLIHDTAQSFINMAIED
jgi:3-hydroxyisobutyrate dehydrogenase